MRRACGNHDPLFPAFSLGEATMSGSLTKSEKEQLASLLRKIIRSAEDA
jgi:hypothetical protein